MYTEIAFLSIALAIGLVAGYMIARWRFDQKLKTKIAIAKNADAKNRILQAVSYSSDKYEKRIQYVRACIEGIVNEDIKDKKAHKQAMNKIDNIFTTYSKEEFLKESEISLRYACDKDLKTVVTRSNK
ncbi:MAG: hypothetical protein WCP14_04400 [bacterium]